jgi:hypothetical protein
MFLRPNGRTESAKNITSTGLAKLGIGFIVVGGLLLAFGVIGGHLSGRPAFAAVVLPVAGVICLIVSYVSYARGLKADK